MSCVASVAALLSPVISFAIFYCISIILDKCNNNVEWDAPTGWGNSVIEWLMYVTDFQGPLITNMDYI